MPVSSFLTALLVLTATVLSIPVDAFPQFVKELPNGDASSRKGSGITCRHLGHEGCVAGAARNKFGADFKAAGYKWTKELCEKDSDGDGLSNGQELGDPCCTWSREGGGKLRQKLLSHPGEASEVNSAPRRCGGGSGDGQGGGKRTCGTGFKPKMQPVCSRTNFRRLRIGRNIVTVYALVQFNTVVTKVKVTGNPAVVFKSVKTTVNGDADPRMVTALVRPRTNTATKKFYKSLNDLPKKLGKSSCCSPPNGHRLPIAVEVQVCLKSRPASCQPKRTVSAQLAIKCGNACKNKPSGRELVMTPRRRCTICR